MAGDHITLAERLHQIRHRPGVPRPLHQITLGERGQHQNRRDGLLRDLLGGGDPVQDRHLHIEDHQIRPVLPGQLDGLLTVTGLADDRIAFFFEHLFEIEADQGLVLCDDDACRQRRDVGLVVIVDGLGRLGGGHGGSSFQTGAASHEPTELRYGWGTEGPCTPSFRRSPGSPAVEAMDSKPIQRRFESDSGHFPFTSTVDHQCGDLHPSR